MNNNTHNKSSSRNNTLTYVFMGVGAVALLIIAMTFAFSQLSKPANTENQADTALNSRLNGADPTPGQAPQTPDGSGNSGNRTLSGKNYLLSDGSLNMTAINAFKQKISGGTMKEKLLSSLSAQLDQEVSQGIITADQSKAIKQAFEIQ